MELLAEREIHADERGPSTDLWARIFARTVLAVSEHSMPEETSIQSISGFGRNQVI